MCEMLYSLSGVILGGLITLVVSNIYYRKSTKDLAQIGEKLYKNTRLVLLGLKNAGLIDVEIEPDKDHTEQFVFKLKLPMK